MAHHVSFIALFLLGLVGAWDPTCTPATPCKVIVDQDCSQGTNTNAVLLALLNPGIKVLGVTVVFGDSWRDYNLAHCYRMLEIMNMTHIPLIAGAEFPTINTAKYNQLWSQQYGGFPWVGMWGKNTTFRTNLGPAVVPGDNTKGGMVEGCTPGLADFLCDCHGHPCKPKYLAPKAAEWIVSTVNKHAAGEVTLVGLGPFTNLALARMLDPSIVQRTRLWLMGSSLNPHGQAQHNDWPRHETNFWFDAYSTRHMLHTDPLGRGWQSITLATVDVTFPMVWSKEFLAKIAAIPTRGAQYMSQCFCATQAIGLVDESAVMLLANPTVAQTQSLWMDVNIDNGAEFGNTMSWHGNPPGLGEPKVTAYSAINQTGVNLLYDAILNTLRHSAPATPEKLCQTGIPCWG